MLSPLKPDVPVSLSPEGQAIARMVVQHFESLNKAGALELADLDATIAALTVSNSSVFPTTSTTPTPTAASGSFTSVSCTLNITKVGNCRLFTCKVTITTNGTAAGRVKVPLPETPAEESGFGGISTVALAGVAKISPAELQIFKYDGTYPGADSTTLEVSGVYRV
jgi:hypothetical protein